MKQIRILYRLWQMALSALNAYKVRGIFVLVAVALGIASLTIIVASIEGANKKAEEIVSAFGSDAMLVFAGSLEQGGLNASSDSLTKSDISLIEQSLSGIKYVMPMRTKTGVSLKYKNNSFSVATVTGGTEDYNNAWGWKIVAGREFSKLEVRRGEAVVLIGETVRKELFKNIDPIGQQITMNGTIRVTVVGVLEERSAGGLYDVNDTIVIPVQTLFQRFNMKRDRYDSIRIVFQNSEQMDSYEEALRSLLRYAHKTKQEDKDDFTIVTPKEVLRFMSFIKGGITIFLGVSALGALTVGGFVLANLFYISVAERTVEIGLKKAIGATRRDILLQFLFESVTLTLMGAGIGCILGVGVGFLLEALDIVSIELSWTVFVSSVVVAILLGIIFGLKPARQASSISPIVALKGGM